MTANVYSFTGQSLRTVELNDQVWGQAVSSALLHQAVVAYLSNARVDVAHGKKRGQVRGGGRKPWRQKGTGRARAGSSRSPLWRGGGLTFGPSQERNFYKRLPRAMRRRALLGALNAKARASEVLIVESLPAEAKTKAMASLFATLPTGGRRALLVVPAPDQTVVQATRNLPRLSVSAASSLNAYDVLANRYLVVHQDALESLNHQLAP